MEATDEALERLLVVEGIVIVGVLALVGGFALVVVRVGLLPLDRMGHTAAAIAGGDLSHRVETTDPRTEVGRLGIALNRMLDRLEDAFAAREASQERLRRFIADASHELRTPLVSIRGYAELYRMGAARSDEDVAKSMRRIEDEAARMGVLVEDLLTLARLDEVRTAPHGPVDLAALARDAVDDARVTAPDRDIDAGRRVPRASPATPTSCARCSPTCSATRSSTRRRARRSRSPSAARTAPSGSRSATTAAACPPTTPTRSSSASGAPRAAASAARAAPASASRSWPGSSTPTPAPSRPRTIREAEPRSRSASRPVDGGLAPLMFVPRALGRLRGPR